MRWTLKEVLKNCRLALKKSLTKRDKWIKEWPGQVWLKSVLFDISDIHYGVFLIRIYIVNNFLDFFNCLRFGIDVITTVLISFDTSF